MRYYFWRDPVDSLQSHKTMGVNDVMLSFKFNLYYLHLYYIKHTFKNDFKVGSSSNVVQSQ